jgi:hypothetical protein
MSTITLGLPQDFYFDAASSSSDLGYKQIHKFGRNPEVGTTPVPISQGGVYQVPTSATTLEAISSSTNDTSAGSGARTITVQGLDGSFDFVTEDITMNGTSASTATTTSFIRVYRAFIKTSGTYANASAGSHSGDITIRAASAGATYAKIDATGFPKGQTQIAVYTVPNGKTAFIKNITIHSDVDACIMFFQRANADDTSAPYTGTMRLIQEINGVNGPVDMFGSSTIGPFEGKTDVGFMASVASGTADIAVDFTIIESV